MNRPLALLLLAAACGSSDAPTNTNPARLWLDTLGSETTGQVQLVPFQPVPF